jgi:Carboxypeptidase regulatory-like domain
MIGRRFHASVLSGALVALCWLAGSAAVLAQTATNTSGLEGKVTDESGAVLPGVTVSISSPSLQAPLLETITDENGHYRFSALPRGVYAVSFSLSGFQKVTRENLNIDAGFVASLDPKLAVGTVEETVTVFGDSPVIDVRTTTVVSSIKKDVLETLPTSRSYEDMGKLAPGIRVTGVPDVGGNHTGGGRGSLVNYGSSNGGSTLMLDGINTDGTAGYYDMGAVDEMIVNAAGNDPEIATPGMAFQVIIKSGGNTFHGDGLYAFQTRELQADNIDDHLRALNITGNPMDGYYDLNGSLGGRILRDRLWFFGSGRRKEYRQEVIGFAGGPGADGSYYTADDETGLTTDRESNVVGKVQSRLTRKQTLSYMRHYNYKKQDNRAGSAFIPHESAGDYELPNTVHVAEYTNSLSDRSLLRLAVGQSYWQSRADPYTDTVPSFDNVTLRYGGAYVNSVGSDSTPAGSFSSRWQYDASYTYFRPSFLGMGHEIKVGGEFTREWYNKFQEARGVGTGGVGNDYQLIFSNGAPFQVRLYNSPFVAKNNVNYQSGFVRDTLRVGDRLSLNVGIRMERYHAFLPAQDKQAGRFSAAASYPESELYEWRSIVPRFGVAYPLTADKKTVVKATYGQFNFALRASDSRTIRNFNKNDYSAQIYRWTDINANRDLDYPGELGTFVQSEGASSTFFNPDIRQPKAHEVTLHLERELAANFASRIGYVYKREADQFQLVNTARPYEVYNVPITSLDPGPDLVPGNADDGGPVTYYDYDPAYRGAAFEHSTYQNVPGYTDRYHNIEVGLDKRMSNRWQMQLSYLATRKNIFSAIVAANSGVPVTPNDEFFPKNETWETTFRASGSYRAPWGIMASSVFEYQSGAPLARTVLFRGLPQLSTVTLRMEPLGSIRLPAVKLLNVRASKQLTFGSHRITIDGDFYNLLNANDATTMTVASGPSFGRITAIVPPRVARIGFSYHF